MGIVWLLGLFLPLAATAEGPVEWDQARVTALAGELHEGVTGLREEIRSRTRSLGVVGRRQG